MFIPTPQSSATAFELSPREAPRICAFGGGDRNHHHLQIHGAVSMKLSTDKNIHNKKQVGLKVVSRT